MDGWIKLHRKFLKWEWFNDNNMVMIFIYLLLKANFESNKWKGIDVKRGQLITSLNSLSQQTGISLQSIRTVLKRLKSTNEITIKSTNKYSIITICNYDSYQFTEYDTNNQTNSQLTNDQQTTNSQLTTDNKENKEKEHKKEDLKPNLQSGKFTFEDKYKYFIELFNCIAKETSGMERSFRGDAKSKLQFKARLKEGYTSGDFAKAIKNLYSNSNHRDNGFNYATPELITRSNKFVMYFNAKY